MVFAFINDNLIVKIEEHEDSSNLNSHLYQHVIDITNLNPIPKVGWEFANGILRSKIPNVTARQIRQALILSGVSLDIILDALSSLPEPTKSLALTEWEYSNTFERHRPLVSSVASLLGWSYDDLDNLWLFAGKL